jgi:hypothetical protein
MSTGGQNGHAGAAQAPRARGADRRRSTWRALWTGNFERRRRGARREADRSLVAIDWHHPQWLVISIVILLLCATDAFLTLALIGAGGSEINPFMRPLVTGAGSSFAFWKLALTSSGVVTLVLLARTRVFGRLPVGQILYLVALFYIGLIGYEVWLLFTRVGIDSVAGLFPVL